MSKVLNTQTTTTMSKKSSTSTVMMPSKKTSSLNDAATSSTDCATTVGGGDADTLSIDFDDFTSSSSILEFLSKEQECCNDEDAESIFQEVSRLADNSDTRSVDEILREAELLIQQQTLLGDTTLVSPGVAQKQPRLKINGTKEGYQLPHNKSKNNIKINSKHLKKTEPVRVAKNCSSPKSMISEVLLAKSHHTALAIPTPQTPSSTICGRNHFTAFVDNLPSESILSDESTPKELQTYTATEKQFPHNDDDTDDGTDTMEEITEGMATVELIVNDDSCGKTKTATTTAAYSNSITSINNGAAMRAQHSKRVYNAAGLPSSSESSLLQQLSSPIRRAPLNFNATQACSPIDVRRNSATRRDSMQTPDSGVSSVTQSTQTPRDNEPVAAAAAAASLPHAGTSIRYCTISTNTAPKHSSTIATSPVEAISAHTREHALKQDIDVLQEKLKDTEERLQSLRIQHDSLSQLHRDLRESNTQLQDESELLKLDVQHLNECATILRTELQTSRSDRSEAQELQKVLQTELEESRLEKKRALEQREKDTKTIQDLQRQCREMERILMRKHPDSVSALIVASKVPSKLSNNVQEDNKSRKLLEQRIAQLEADAKEQDKKAQQILANVQARFNSVQSKYETHIADLETQVLSLQEINTKLNEKIESQVRTLDYFVTKKAERYYNNCTQTDQQPIYEDRLSILKQHSSTNATATQTAKANTRDHSTNTIAAATPANNSHPQSASSSTSSTANSTPNNSRPNSKQSGLRKPTPTVIGSLSSALASKLPVSRSDSTISLSSHAKEDAHLLATVRGMRVDLALKDKAMQRLSRELDECKKTIRKLQKDAAKADKPHSASGSSSTLRRSYDASNYAVYEQKPANTESQALKEAQNKIKLLEADYKSLHDKRLQDLKTLQSAHERELSSCHETVRILQQRLNERDEAFATQKRRKVPVDYYALKAKVTSLERRHSEREERLHMLVEALSKGRLNGALEDLLGDNNNA